MPTDLLAPAALGLLPVLVFLLMLLALDSYKLVRLRLVVGVLAAGALTALLGMQLNGFVADALDLSFSQLTRYVAPVVEETVKAAVIVVLLRTHRVGFLIDAAICGFAVGTGFAAVENLWYLQLLPAANSGVWLLRGFGTAIMHGGASALFAIVTLALIERHGRIRWHTLLPGLLLAVALHSIYNHFFLSPFLSTVGILLVLPPLLYYAFQRSERAVGDWVGRGFDSDTDMLELIDSDRFDESPVGRYLRSLKDKLDGPVVADVFCYLRLHTELALRAKGKMMLRESGFVAPPDPDTRAKLAELDYLRKSIGRTMLLALHQHLRMSHKELWQITMAR
jgi:RsiW-degrading membrane proteinase PrsW (M82 family)